MQQSLDSLIALMILALPTLVTYFIVFKQTLNKGGDVKLADQRAFVASVLINCVFASLLGMALLLVAKVVHDPAGYGKMMLLHSGMFTLFIGPVIGAVNGLFWGVVAFLISKAFVGRR